jgi:hypothetical protein
MLTELDVEESERNPQLGPLMPADGVIIDSFGNLADTFVVGCDDLMHTIQKHWQKKCAAHLKSHADKLEAYLVNSIKTRATLNQENQVLLQKAVDADKRADDAN